MTATKTTTLKLQCHCQNASFTISLPSTSFPLSSAFCCCSSCRYSTGQLAVSVAQIPLSPNSAGLNDLRATFKELGRYESSRQRARYFCPTCGANVVDFEVDDVEGGGRWHVCTGVISISRQTQDESVGDQISRKADTEGGKSMKKRRGLEGMLDRRVIWVDDTLDGGLSVWLKQVTPHYTNGTGSPEVDPGSFSKDYDEHRTDHSDRSKQGEKLLVKCHCGGMNFYILPPSPEKGKYHAEICVCNSCTTTAGFEFTAGTSVPFSQLQMPNGVALDLGATTVKRYESSKGVYRLFCGACGATVGCEKTGQDWLDISVGLLGAEEGVRAERWLEWPDHVEYAEEAMDQELVESIGEAMIAWKKRERQGQ